MADLKDSDRVKWLTSMKGFEMDIFRLQKLNIALKGLEIDPPQLVNETL